MTNEERLSRGVNIVGAHKASESLELLSLADFLTSWLNLSHSEAAAYCLETHSLPCLARLLRLQPGLALPHLPLLLELGDVGRRAVESSSPPVQLRVSLSDTAY